MGHRSTPLLSAVFAAALATVIAAPAAVLAAAPNVVAPPTIAMAFGAATLPVNDSTSLTFTIANPNGATALTGIAFADILPNGLVVAFPNGLTGSCGGGTITATASSSQVSLSGASLGAGASCTFSIDIIGISPGVQTNTTGAISSNEGGTGGSATASITVGWAPTISMVFNPASISANGTSTLTLTLNNPETNSNDLDGLGFTDTLPTGLSVADGSASACNGGTLTTSGGNTISLVGASLPVSWMCSFSVTVTGPAAAGTYTNKTGSLTSTNGIPGQAATASLVVAAPNTTSPPTSTGRSNAPGRSDPRMPMLLLLAFVAGFVAVRRAGIRGHNPVQG